MSHRSEFDRLLDLFPSTFILFLCKLFFPLPTFPTTNQISTVNHLKMAESPVAVTGDKDQPENLSHRDSHDKNELVDSGSSRKPTMADYFRVFSYATKWDFCIYGVACFASIAGGATMPLSK